MSHFTTSFQKAAPERHFAFLAAVHRLVSLLSKIKPARRPKSDIAYLEEFSDAELADIGLLRSELNADPVDTAIDSQVQAMLRVYR